MIPRTVEQSIGLFRRAFAVARIEERGVKVTWDLVERWCRLRCRLPDGRVVERILRGDDTANGTAEALVHAMSLWCCRAAKRARTGGDFADETCEVLR